jgi:AAA+ ATPase superfamily predicted ATPase
MSFVGRAEDLARLRAALEGVRSSGEGRMLSVRGPRQVGKSRLLTEFVETAQTPYLYFTAVKDATIENQLGGFAEAAAASRAPVPNAAELFAGTPSSWSDVFGRLRLAASVEPIVVVLDEFPWAVHRDVTLEARLQVAWDQQLERVPVLLVLVGSDVAMMERLTQHDRPLYGRANEREVRPFTPAECHLALGSGHSSVAGLDAYLVTGGYPRLVEELRRAGSARAFVTNGLQDENSPLVIVGQRVLDAEFPPEVQARKVLSAIGHDEVGKATFSNAVARIGSAPDSAAKTAVTRGLDVLKAKGVLDVLLPFGSDKSRLTRYRIVDPYLSLWLRFIEPYGHDIARGRPDIAVAAFDQAWSGWRGRAIEAVVRAAVFRLGASLPALDGVVDVGGWWNRENNPEVDLVAGKGPHRVDHVGTIKWRERKPISAGELADLAAARAVVPHAAAAKLITVSLAGLAPGVSSDLHLGPDELVHAWA